MSARGIWVWVKLELRGGTAVTVKQNCPNSPACRKSTSCICYTGWLNEWEKKLFKMHNLIKTNEIQVSNKWFGDTCKFAKSGLPLSSPEGGCKYCSCLAVILYFGMWIRLALLCQTGARLRPLAESWWSNTYHSRWRRPWAELCALGAKVHAELSASTRNAL